MSRFPEGPVIRREIDLSWGGLLAANVAVFIALLVILVRGHNLGMW
jgi:hypothetical protein